MIQSRHIQVLIIYLSTLNMIVYTINSFSSILKVNETYTKKMMIWSFTTISSFSLSFLTINQTNKTNQPKHAKFGSLEEELPQVLFSA